MPTQNKPDLNFKRWRTFTILASLVILLQGTAGVHPFDDAYITYRYAWNLSQGLGLVYNSGEHVLGTTTPLYTIVLALGAWGLAAPQIIPLVSFVLTIGADVVSAVVLFNLVTRAWRLTWLAWAVTLLWIIHPLRLDVATGGMETSVFTMLLLLAYDRYLRTNPSYYTIVFLALALLTRPEAVLAIIPIGLTWLKRNPRHALFATGLGCLILAPWLIWATLYYGSPIPNSLTAKAVAYSDHLIPAIHSLATFFATGTIGIYAFTPLLLIALIFWIALYAYGLIQIARHAPIWLTFASYPLLYALSMTIANAPLMFGWYYPPLLPALIFTNLSGIWLATRLPLRWRQGLIVALLIVAVLIPFVYQRLQPSWILVHDETPPLSKDCFLAEVPNQPDSLVLAVDIGKIGYCLNRARILDAVGLVSPQAIPYLTSGERTIFDPRLIEDLRPTHIVAMEQWLAPILTEPVMRENYVLVKQNLAALQTGAQNLLIFKRMDAP